MYPIKDNNPGGANRTRVVKFKTLSGLYNHTLNKIVILPLEI